MKIIRMITDVQGLKQGEIYEVSQTYGDNEIFEVEGVLVKCILCEELFYTPVKIKNTIVYYNERTRKNDTHLYQREVNTIIRANSGNKTASYQKERLEEVYKVIYNDDITICVIDGKYKGVAKRNPHDIYSRQIGHDLAVYRARIRQYEDKIANICD